MIQTWCTNSKKESFEFQFYCLHDWSPHSG